MTKSHMKILNVLTYNHLYFQKNKKATVIKYILIDSSKIETEYKKTHLHLTRCNQYPLLPAHDNVVSLFNTT